MLRYRLRRIETFLCRAASTGGNSKRLPRPVQTPQDILDLLQEQVDAVRADSWAGAVEKARAIAYLASVARKTHETSTMAARLEMLELVLKQRQGEQNP